MPNTQGTAIEDLELIVDTMAAPVTRCSRDLRHLWVSKAYAAWLGRAPHEIVGRPIADVIGAEGLAGIRPHVDRVLAGDRVEYEERIFFRDLGWRWIHAAYTPTHDSAGVVDGWVAVVIDVDASRRQRTLLEHMFQADPGALAVLVGHELRFAVANPAYRALLAPGVDPIGKTYASVWSGEEMREAEGRLREALFASTPVRTDREERVCGDGKWRVFTSQSCPLRWDDEPAVMSVLWETTALEEAQRQAEHAAEETARIATELRAVLEAIPDALLLFDLDGRIAAANSAAERLLGFTPEEHQLTVQERWGIFSLEDADGKRLSPEDLPAARALAGGVAQNVEMRIRRINAPQARPLWVSASAAPLRDSRGNLRGAVATYTDISRLHELHQEREDLFRMVTHDLRAPLAAIGLHAQQIARRPEKPDMTRHKAQAIRSNVERMDSMIGELAELVLLESGHAKPEPTNIEVNAAVGALLHRLGESVAVERVRVEGGPLRVHADPASLERVLVNLLTNALKYSPADEPVAVRITPCGEHVCITVADRGPGIDADDQRRIFERFYRRAKDARSQGLGLGLYITRMLVAQMGGTIELESKPGEGSAFTVLLPAAPDPVGEIAPSVGA